MKTKYIFIVFLAFLLNAGGVKAQDIISAQQLAKIYKNPDVVVVSTRKTSDYKKVHILGAVHIDHHDLYKEGPVASMIKSPDELAKIFGAQGISDTKEIVLYDDGSGKYAGRVYWILKYLGAKNVKILDGHMAAWKAARKPVTKNPTKIKPATFTPHVNKALLATMADVQKAVGSGSAVIVDARSAGEFNGTAASTTLKRKGHIPGAVNIEYKQLMDANGKIKPAAELQKIFNAKGVTKDKEVILYCESSVRAGIEFLVLTSILKYPNVKVYDGAFLEWESVSGNKVEK